jgi:hypothetical protein
MTSTRTIAFNGIINSTTNTTRTASSTTIVIANDGLITTKIINHNTGITEFETAHDNNNGTDGITKTIVNNKTGLVSWHATGIHNIKQTVTMNSEHRIIDGCGKLNIVYIDSSQTTGIIKYIFSHDAETSISDNITNTTITINTRTNKVSKTTEIEN